LSHAFETRLGRLRSGEARAAGGELWPALASCRDRLAVLLAETPPAIGAEGAGGPAALTAEDGSVLAALDAALRPASQALPADSAFPEPAPQPQREEGQERKRPAGEGYARVSSAMLERILALSSEVAVALSNLSGSVRATGNHALLDEVAALESLAASLYKSVLDTRMVPFGEIAERYRRAVDEIARTTGKRIRFELSGAETEIEKSLADRLAEPLLHLVRNAADHGIEAPSLRLARGKPEEGVVALRASRGSGLLMLAVEDDGAGVDPEAVRLRAMEAGLLGADEKPDPAELMDFLFEPGFSLSGEVTRWSGRGVGLDVVKKSVAKLRGLISLSSAPGSGSSARLRLPLSLSLVEGFAAKVGGLSLLVPFDVAASCVELPAGTRGGGDPFRAVELGGRLVPCVDLAGFFGDAVIPGGGAGEASASARYAILLDLGGEETGLIVDEVGETLQAAVRPLDGKLADSPGLAGYAIRGDGSLILVVDASELSRLAGRAISSGGCSRSGRSR
jgi:two-component system chemotaxis sensor kinase CheA